MVGAESAAWTSWDPCGVARVKLMVGAGSVGIGLARSRLARVGPTSAIRKSSGDSESVVCVLGATINLTECVLSSSIGMGTERGVEGEVDLSTRVGPTSDASPMHLGSGTSWSRSSRLIQPSIFSSAPVNQNTWSCMASIHWLI
jgi:hypothetical protein